KGNNLSSFRTFDGYDWVTKSGRPLRRRLHQPKERCKWASMVGNGSQDTACLRSLRRSQLRYSFALRCSCSFCETVQSGSEWLGQTCARYLQEFVQAILTRQVDALVEANGNLMVVRKTPVRSSVLIVLLPGVADDLSVARHGSVLDEKATIAKGPRRFINAAPNTSAIPPSHHAEEKDC